jgi:hypothetical protein
MIQGPTFVTWFHRQLMAATASPTAIVKVECARGIAVGTRPIRLHVRSVTLMFTGTALHALH